MIHRRLAFFVITGVILWSIDGFGWTAPALAQSNEELNGSLQFNFHTPGARSLGIGRAFTGRADDATAAYANPAGLIWLREPEVSFEGRNSSFTTIHIDGGRADGEPTGLGIDTVREPIYSETERDTTGLSFVSLVYPITPSWRIAVYRHELANFEAGIDRSEGIFFALRRPDAQGEQRSSRVVPVQAAMELDIVSTGLSAAYEVNQRLWAGLGVSYYDFELLSVWEGFPQPTEPSFNAAVFSPELSGGTRIHDGEGDDLGLIAGLLWRTLDDRWAIGAVYRQGPSFDFDVSRFGRQPGDPPCGQLADPPAVPCGELPEPDSESLPPVDSGTFDAPDVYSLGVTFRPVPVWILSAEWDRVTYSDLTPTVNVLTIANSPEINLSEFEIGDGDELHLGVERAVHLSGSELYLRLGSWLDPDHQLRWRDRPPLSTTRVDGVDVPTNDAVRLEARFPGGDDEIHYTGGAGISISRYRVDLGADISDRGDVYSLSAVLAF